MISFFVVFKDAAVFVGRWVQLHSAFVTATATAVIAVFTWALVCANRKLWQASQEHSKHLQDSVAISREAADAAKKSAEVAETALHISERAYLSIDQIGFVEPLKVGEMPNLKLKIINTGKTPAQIIDTSTNVKFFDKIPSIPVYPTGQKSQSQMTIRPGGEHTLVNIRGYTVTTKQFSDMFKGTQKLLIWGRIIYQDIFKHLMVVGFGAEFFVDNFLPVEGYNYIEEYKEGNKD